MGPGTIERPLLSSRITISFIFFFNKIAYQPYVSYNQLWVRLTMNPNLVLGVMITSGFGIGTFIAVGVLLIQQLKIALTNTTGIEQWILEKAKWRRKEILKVDGEFLYPYNIGWRENMCQTFFPTTTDGIYYPVVEGSHQYALTIEQKLQKDLKKEKAVRFECIKSYSGWVFPIWQFPKAVVFSPCCDDTIALEAGEEIIITRGRKHWFYGYRPNNLMKRGFIPKAALKEIGFEAELEDNKKIEAELPVEDEKEIEAELPVEDKKEI